MAVVSLLVVSHIGRLDGVGYELNGISYASFAIADSLWKPSRCWW